MILSDITLIRFQFTNQQLQERRLSNTVWSDDRNSTAQVNTKLGLDEQIRLAFELERDI